MWVADHSRYRYSISKAYEPDELVGCLFLWCRILVINLQDSISFGGRENVTEVSLSCVRFAINSSFPIVSFGRPHKKTVSKGCRFVVAPVMFARVSWNWNPRHHQRYQRLSCWESTRNGVGRSPRETAWQHGSMVQSWQDRGAGFSFVAPTSWSWIMRMSYQSRLAPRENHLGHYCWCEKFWASMVWNGKMVSFRGKSDHCFLATNVCKFVCWAFDCFRRLWIFVWMWTERREQNRKPWCRSMQICWWLLLSCFYIHSP